MERVRSCYAVASACVVSPLIRTSDAPELARRKRVIAGVIMWLSPLTVILLLNNPNQALATVAEGTAAATCLVTYVGWALFPTFRMELVLLFGFLAVVMAGDYYRLSRGDRLWSLAVPLVDCALVLNLEDGVTSALVAALLVYFAFVCFDRSATQFYTDASPGGLVLCDCAEPPCLQQPLSAFVDGALMFTVFLVDVYLTRGFAAGMRHQMAVIEQAIGVTGDIAALLARYEVEEGRALLEGEQGELLPPVLKDVLLQLLGNLDEYKPYLPDAMLVRASGVGVSLAEPPGLGQEDAKVTVCFTDIQSSTELWEGHPQAMHSALMLHNDVVREVVRDTAGYEVKVIGDSFMLAFADAAAGCRFGVDVQLALAAAKWPSDLLLHPLCTPAAGPGDALTWNGLRVRVGLNCGPVRVEKNPVTGRCDYFGSTVNVAARVEGSLRHGGLTGVTAAVLEELGPAGLQRLGDVLQVPLDAADLKGVAVPVQVTVLLPKQLADRKAVMNDHVPALARVCSVASVGSNQSDERALGMRRRGSMLPTSPGVSRRPVTCACFRARPDTDVSQLISNVAEMLEAVEAAADASQGVLAATLSVQCTVVWNGARACHDHYAQCLMATDFVRRSQPDVAVGGCSGEAVHGNIAASRKKHSTVVGGCVELAAALAEEAERAGTAALAATTFGSYCSTQRRTRWYAEWQVLSRAEGLTVWSLTPPKLSLQQRWTELRCDTDDVPVIQLKEDTPATQAPKVSATPGRSILVGAGVAPACVSLS